MRIVPVDADSPLFEEWHDVYVAAERHHQGEHATVWQREELRVTLRQRTERLFVDAWAGVVDDRVVSTGWLEGSLVDNLETTQLHVTTAPAERRRGYAAAVLAHLEDAARARGRSLLLGELAWAVDDQRGERSDDLRWARSHGFAIGLVDVQRRLTLPVAEALLEELAAEAAPYHQGYEVRSFVGAVPDDLVAGWAALSSTLMTEAPMGEIAREAELADVDGVRESEARIAEQGREKVSTAVLAPDGELVAFTDLGVTVHEPDRAYQWGTLVRGDHRGHRLGLAVKVANLRLLQETQPQITTVVTFNADVNAHMIAVNERIGFRPVQRLGELQKRL